MKSKTNMDAVKLFMLDLKEFDSTKSVEIRIWANKHGNIRIISVAQDTKPTMLVSATSEGIENMQKQFDWIEEVRSNSRDDCLQISMGTREIN